VEAEGARPARGQEGIVKYKQQELGEATPRSADQLSDQRDSIRKNIMGDDQQRSGVMACPLRGFRASSAG
jgi:hypothetical protein